MRAQMFPWPWDPSTLSVIPGRKAWPIPQILSPTIASDQQKSRVKPRNRCKFPSTTVASHSFMKGPNNFILSAPVTSTFSPGPPASPTSIPSSTGRNLTFGSHEISTFVQWLMDSCMVWTPKPTEPQPIPLSTLLPSPVSFLFLQGPNSHPSLLFLELTVLGTQLCLVLACSPDLISACSCSDTTS